MILGIGTDLVQMDRISQAIERFGDRFLLRVFTDREIKNAPARRTEYFAGRFAAKEAAIKALRPQLDLFFGLSEIEVGVLDDGAPTLSFLGRAEQRAEDRGVTGAHLSLSHDGGLAVATVVLEG